MITETQFTKNQILGLQLLGGFFDALRHNRLSEFLISEELERFRQETRHGYITGKTPGGIPLDVLRDIFHGLLPGGDLPDFGGKLPRDGLPDLGGKDPLDVLDDLYSGLGGGLGKYDNSGEGADPAAIGAPTRTDDGHGVVTTTYDDGNGNITVIREDSRDGSADGYTQHSDGSREKFSLSRDGEYLYSRTDAEGNTEYTRITPDRVGGGFTIEEGSHRVKNDEDSRIVRHHDGKAHSPGEDGGGEANSGRNPLSSLQAVGPQSMQQMLAGMRFPGKDPNELDPNSGKDGFELSKQDQERLGRTAPAADVLDPNSGIDPLSQFNIDPDQINSKEDEIRPEYDSKTKSGN